MAINKSTKVQKMLTDEEKAIIGNVKSLLGQLEQLETAEEIDDTIVEETADMPPNDNDVYREDDEEEIEEKEEDETVEKDTTASDDAEDRVDDGQPEESEEAMQMLAKALLGQLKKSRKPKRKVQKSASNSDIIELKKLIAGVAKMQLENTTAIEGILEGYGLADKIKKSYEDKTAKTKPVGYNDADSRALKALLAQVVNGKPEEKTDFNVRKGIADVMKSITGGK